ncbi:type II toxin-antitoxin system VapC family toxin [uncultured Hymenobacter sp.]|uniref:type II toxin-antitoxin system VapC family toxin n=1 Tax=uncultured Hymenobacter sp. TaxID=170016 RepID=UPI0035CBDE73
MRVLVDTNIIIELWRNNPQIIERLRSLVPDGIIISATTQAELIVGALNKADLRKILQNLRLLEILPLESAIGVLANELLTTHTLSHRLQFPDALIAATALHHSLPLFTLNRKDFRYITGLQLHEPA